MWSSGIGPAGIVMMLLLNVAPATARDFTLESYFAGRTAAIGSFSAINGVKRSFAVNLTGTWNGTTLTLVEDFTYDDGERERKTWRFKKIDKNKYRGTREDVVGDTLVTITGDTARFSYLVYLDAKRKSSPVRFHDTMTLQEDGTVRNRALVTKFGLPVAVTRVEFRRR